MRRAKEIYILLVMMPLMIDGTRQFPDEPRPWQWAPSRTTISTSPSSTEFLWGEFSTITSANLPLPETTSPSTESIILSTSTKTLSQSTVSTIITEISTLFVSTTTSKITEITTQSTPQSKLTDSLTQISRQNTNSVSQDSTSIMTTIPSQTTLITAATQSSSNSVVTTIAPEPKTSIALSLTKIITNMLTSQTTDDDDHEPPMIKNITKSTENVLFSTGNGAKNPNTAENPNPHRGMVSTRVTDNREELSSRGNGPGVTLTTMSQEDAKKIQPIQNVTKLPFDFENQNTFAITNKVSSEFKNKNATFSETNTREDFNENKETRFRNSDNPEFGNNDPNMNSGGRNNVPNTQRYNPTNRQNNPDRNFPPENGNMNPPDVGGGGGDDEMPTRSFTTPQDDRSTDFRDREATTDRAATEIWSFRPTEEMTAANPNWPTRNDRRETTTRFNLEFNPGRPNSKTTTDTPDDIDAERVTPKRATYTQRMPTTQFVIVKKDPNNKREGWNRHSVLGIGD